ncbi:MAG: SUMF1/EgtB/PvdO family nonheme iron enzyme [Myxococcales bacterium]|nr:SUMF1/EgtB/PvdO family nonheme iron enzyme [Myxococcales bacterium]
MLCFRCGSHNPDGSEFCSQCGQKFGEKKKTPAEPVAAPVSAPRPTEKPPEEAPQLQPGRQIGERYQVKAVVGTGPVGTVYRAHDLEIDVDVAVKVIAGKLLQTKEEKKKFLVEIRNARKINHPNVVRLYDEDQQEDLTFFTMQLLEGLSLRKIIRLRQEKNQQFAIKEIEPIFSHVCQALDRAHEVCVHGGLKPENVIVLPDMLKLTDFGLLEALPRRPFVAAQAAAHCLAYLAPEIREGEQRAEPAADTYSLGVILWEMISGRLYEGPASSLGQVPAEFEPLLPVVKRALNEQPGKRPRTAREFFDELHTAMAPGRSRVSRPPRPAPAREEEKPAAAPQPAPTARPSTRPEMPAVSRPPKPAPAARKVSDGFDDAPPTVVDAAIMLDSPRKEEPAAPTPPVDENRLIEELAGEAQEEVEANAAERESVSDGEMMEEEITDETSGAKDQEAAEDGSETQVARPATPVRPAPERQAEVRVALPVNQQLPVAAAVQSQAPKKKTSSVMRRAPAPVSAGPSAARFSSPPAGVPPVSQGPGGAVYPGAPYPPQAYGPFSQPVIYTQPPAPPSRLPWIVLILGILVFAGALAAVLVLMKSQQDELAETKKLLAAAITKEPSKAPETQIQPPPAADAEKARAAAEEARKAEEAKKAEEARKAEEAKKAEEARLAEEARKVEEAKKAEEAKRLEEAKRADEARKALLASRNPEDRRRAREEERRAREEERRRIEEEKQRAREEARRKAEERAAEERARKEEEARRKAEAEKARTASRLPVEEVPDVGGGESPPPEPVRPAEPPPSPPAPVEEEKVAAAAPPAGKGACPRGMIHIPGGDAAIGSAISDPMRNFGEIKLHTVTVGAFCIDIFEYPNGKGAKPVTGVSWAQADQMCKKKGKRLCTEEEWEFACKGRGNLSFPYGNTFDPEACNSQNADGEGREVGVSGAFAKCFSPFGVADMSGNVSEWTASRWADGVGDRTYKGGSASRPNWAVRCASRSNLPPGSSKGDLGFRCCADPK